MHKQTRDADDDRAISPVVGVILLLALVLLLSVSVATMMTGFGERLDQVSPTEVYQDDRCAGDRVVEFHGGNVDQFADTIRDNPCALWLDGSSVETSGDRVTRWPDQGPSGADGTAPSGQEPTLLNASEAPGGINASVIQFENNATFRGSGADECSLHDEVVNLGGGIDTCAPSITDSDEAWRGIRTYDEGDYLDVDRDVSDLGLDEDSGMAVITVVYTRSFDKGGIYTAGRAGTEAREFSLRTCGADRSYDWFDGAGARQFSDCPNPGEDPGGHWRGQHWERADVDFEAPAKEWHLVVHHYDGEEVTIRVDGTEVATETTDLDLQTNRDIQIGRWERLHQSYYLNGSIAQVLMYDRTLSDGEITDIEAFIDTYYGDVDLRDGP